MIKGYDKNKDPNNSKKNCETGGLMLRCTGPNSPWHGFKSDDVHWEDTNGVKPCVNDGGFVAYAKEKLNPKNFINVMREQGAKKIWAPRQSVTLIGGPRP